MKRKIIPVLVSLLLISCEKGLDLNEGIMKFYGDAYEDLGYSIAQTTDGYLITGQYTQIFRSTTQLGSYIDSSLKKIIVLKTNTDGDVVWKSVLGGNLTGSGTKVIALDDGTCVVAGFVNDPKFMKDIYVAKIGTDGSIISGKSFNIAGNQYSTDIIKTPSGYLLLGTTDEKREPLTESTGNAAGKKDIMILSLDNSFNSIIPIPAQGFPGNDEGAAIKQDPDGGYIIIGTTDRSDQPSSVQAANNVILMKMNPDGNITKPRILGGLNNESVADFEVVNDGYMIAGTIGTEGSDQRGYIWKVPFNINSDPLLEHEVDIDATSSTKSLFSVKAMCRYKTNSFLVAGQTGTGLSSRFLIFAIDASGYLLEDKKKITGGTGTQSANDVISDTEENVTIVGSNIYENNSLITFLKFRF